MEIYLTAEVPMGINIDQLRVQRNRYQMTPSTTHIFFTLNYHRNLNHFHAGHTFRGKLVRAVPTVCHSVVPPFRETLSIRRHR